MNKDNLLDIRNRELRSFYANSVGVERGIRSQAAIPEKTAMRLSMGGRIRAKNDYELVIRVQNELGPAMRHAQDLKDRLEAKGERVDVAVVKRIHTSPRSSSVGTRRPFGAKEVRPLEIGYSIGHRDGGPGTIGVFVETSEGQALITCNHVIANANAAKVGDFIHQQGPPDDVASTKSRVGTLGDYFELTKTGANLFDAALCILNEDVAVLGNVIPAAAKAPDSGKALKGPIDPFSLSAKGFGASGAGTIAKIGRSTGYTSIDLNKVSIGVDDVIVDIPGSGNHRFDDMIEVEWTGRKNFTKAGDSGAIYYLEGSRDAFALHVAGGTLERNGRTAQVSYGCPLQKVMQKYKAKLM